MSLPTPYRIIQHLQNSPLTGWMWRYWQHNETGEIELLPMWNNPDNRYTRLKLKE